MGNPVNIGVTMQYQETSEWCWIAVATSISHFYDSHSTVTQCGLVTAVGQVINKFASNTSACPGVDRTALNTLLATPTAAAAKYCLDTYLGTGPDNVYRKSGGVGDPLRFAGNCANYPGNSSTLTLAIITQEIKAGRPVAVDFAWKDGSGQHTVAIAGVSGSELLICDPIYGTSTVSYASFPGTYQAIGGTLISYCLTMPGAVAGGGMTSFALHGNSTRLYYADSNGWMHELGWTGSAWEHTFLKGAQAVAAGSPTLAGHSPTSFALNGDATRLYYADASGWLHELGWTGSQWEHTPLQAFQNNAAAAPASAVTSFELQGSTRLYYLDASGWVHELGWTGSAWEHTPLASVQARFPAAAGSALASFAVNGVATRLYYLDAAGWVHELGWTGSSWEHTPLQSTQAGASAAPGSDLTCFGLGGNATRLYYLDTAGWLHELGWTGNGWQHTPLGTVQQGSSAALETALVSFEVNGNASRLYYIDKSAWVHELGWTGSGWEHTALQATQGLLPVKAWRSLSGFALNGTDSRIYYLNRFGGISELAWSNNAWSYSAVG